MKKEEFIKYFIKKYDENRSEELSQIKPNRDKVEENRKKNNLKEIPLKTYITSLKHIPDIFFSLIANEKSFIVRYDFSYAQIYAVGFIDLVIHGNAIDIRFQLESEDRELQYKIRDLNFSCPRIITGTHKEVFNDRFNKYIWLSL